jgi:hypothetical protein
LDDSVFSVAFGQGDINYGIFDCVSPTLCMNETIDGVVDELSDAAPLLEIDLAEHGKDPGGRDKVEFFVAFWQRSVHRSSQVGDMRSISGEVPTV